MRRQLHNGVLCLSTLLSLLAVCAPLAAQTVTGTILGLVTDSSDAAVPGASVSARNELTGETRRTETNETGSFALPALQPGRYTLTVEARGFRPFERPRLVLTANDRLSVGKIVLQLGQRSEKIVVTAERPAVQTASGENSALLSSTQVSQLLVRGRDIVSFLRLLPGVAQTTDTESLGGQSGTTSPSIAGTRTGMNTFALDGQVTSDADAVQNNVSSVSVDAIAEVKVLINNYSAEYGRNPGGYISIVSKSGSRDFHGSASWFKRHEEFNANDFFNNVNRLVKPLYRYNTYTFTLGGPVFWPGKFNSKREKLFFFYAREDWRVREPVSPFQTTMPTELERAGDFSKTVDVNQQLIVVKDPATGQPFPGNRVPANNINPYGQAMLKIFPLPNRLDRSVTFGNYNYVFQDVRQIRKTMNQLKLDWNATSNDRLSVRPRTWDADTRAFNPSAGFTSNWNQLSHHYEYTEHSVLANYTRTLNPRMVNEATGSIRQLGEKGPPLSADAFDQVTRSKVGLGGLGQLSPSVNPLGIIPAMTFGGVLSPPTVGYDSRFPVDAGDRRWSLADNFSWTRGLHNLKFGMYFERNRTNKGWRGSGRAPFGGSFDFSRDPNNPSDSNYAFANALLGNFTTYTESMGRNYDHGTNYLLEWFAQDSWAMTRTFRVEVGLRFFLYSPWYLDRTSGSSWVQQRWDPAQAPELFRPAIAPDGRRMAQNPITKAFLPAALIGAVVPNYGNRLNGVVLGNDTTYPEGWRDMRPVELGPHLGFAWDPFGNGRTAIRGGGMIALQTQMQSSYIFGDTTTSPPIIEIPVLYYGTLASLLNATGYFPPSFLPSWEKTYKSPKLYGWSFGVQRDVGFNTVLNVAYVGNVMRHMINVRDLNAIPYGARFLPQNADPTNPGKPLPDSFLVPYRGFGTLSLAQNSGISNYNALQVTADRRFSRGFQFSAAYTWSKTMNQADGYARVPMFFSDRIWLYGKGNNDQTHVLIVNYTWDVPKGSRLWDNPVSRVVLDNWQLSGIASIYSGTPRGITLTTTDNADIAGGGDGYPGYFNPRPIVTGKAPLPHGQRTFVSWFDTSVFARPPKGNMGNAPKDVVRAPGANNWDLSLFKNFPLGAEARVLQFRAEFYNAFNHTQYLNIDTTARFDPAGRQVNARFGQVIATRTPRVAQLALVFKF